MWGRNPIWTRLGRGNPIQSCQMLFQYQGIGGQGPGRSVLPRPELLELGSYVFINKLLKDQCPRT
jgi:hypothetical protein